jgi:plasmid stabilization system protein ParE
MILFSSDAFSDVERIREFLKGANPAAAKRALAAIWQGLERVEKFPALGRPTTDPDIRQIVIPVGGAGYIVRHCILPDDGSLLVIRIWHGRESRADD